jgi:acyl dehydratase
VYALGVGGLSLVQRGIPPWRLIHGEQEFSWRRAVRVGETLTSQGRIADVYQKRNLQFVIAESRVTDEAGEEVCLSRTTVVVLPESGAPANLGSRGGDGGRGSDGGGGDP